MSTDLIEFFKIKDKFLSLLNDKNSRYLYWKHYINTVNESVTTQIEAELIYYILFIQKECSTFRIRNNVNILQNKYNSKKEIVFESQNLLKKFKATKIIEINIILKFEKNIIYENKIKYGVEYTIDYHLIVDINFSELYSIIKNLEAIHILRNINNKIVDDNLCVIIRYLLCFNYFNYNFIE